MNKNEAPSAPATRPVSILRRSSTGASRRSGALLNQSSHTIDSELSASDRVGNNNSTTPIVVDANELADRLLNFKKGSSESNNKTNNNVSAAGNRPPPPPPPPRPPSSAKQREMKEIPPQNNPQRDTNKPWDQSREDEYVRTMASLQLEQSDGNGGGGSSEYSSERQQKNVLNASLTSSNSNNSNEVNDSSMTHNNSVNNSKFNSSSVKSFTPRPVRVSQFEDSWSAHHNEESPVPRPKTTMAVSLPLTPNQSPGPDNITTTPASASTPHSVVVLSTPQNCDKRGRCKTHPQYKLYKKKLLGGYEFIRNCPDCVAASPYNPKLRGRNRSRTGENNSSVPAAAQPRRNSRSRERGRSKSQDRTMPFVPQLNGPDDEDDHANCRENDRGRKRSSSRSKSLDRRGSRGRDEQQRARTRSRDGDRDFNASSGSILDKSLNVLENIRGKIPTSSSHDGNSRRHRSQSREERRVMRRSRSRDGDRDFNASSGSILDKSLNALEHIRGKKPTHDGKSSRHRSKSREERRMSSVNNRSLEKGLCALDKGERSSRRNSKSSWSQDETSTGRSNFSKSSWSQGESSAERSKKLGSNTFVSHPDDAAHNFDKKTGRCKKHPSIILAKKSKFRSNAWEIIKKNGCPFCLEAANGHYEEDAQGFNEETKRNMDNLLRDASNPPTLKSKKTSYSRDRDGNITPSGQQIVDSIPPPEGIKGRKVSKLLYTTPLGETGWYTGDVDTEGKPHGRGRMRFKTGHSYEGEWNHGYSEEHMENLNRMKSGFGSNKAAWKQSETAPCVRRAAVAEKQYTPSPASAAAIISPGDSSQLMASSNAMYQYPQHTHQNYTQAQHMQQLAMMSQATWTQMSPQERQMAMSQWYASNGMSPGQQTGYPMQGYPPM